MNAWEFFHHLFGNKRALNYSFIILLIVIIGLLIGIITGRVQITSEMIKIVSTPESSEKAEKIDHAIKKLEGKVLKFNAFDVELKDQSTELKKYQYRGNCKVSIDEKDNRLKFEGLLDVASKGTDLAIGEKLSINAVLVDVKDNYLHFQYDLFTSTKRWAGMGLMMIHYRELGGNIIKGYSVGAATEKQGHFKISRIEGAFGS